MKASLAKERPTDELSAGDAFSRFDLCGAEDRVGPVLRKAKETFDIPSEKRLIGWAKGDKIAANFTVGQRPGVQTEPRPNQSTF